MAWTAYGAVECGFLSILPWLRPAVLGEPPLEWRRAALLFSIYLGVGLLLGGISGIAVGFATRQIRALRKAEASRLLSATVLFTLIWALAINLAVLSPPGWSGEVRLVVAMALSSALAWSVWPGSGRERLGFLLNPWSLSLLLLGLPWVTNKLLLHSSSVTKAGASLIYFAAVCLGARLLQRRSPQTEPDFSWKPVVRLAGLAGIVLGSACYLEHRPPPVGAPFQRATRGGLRTNVILITLDTVRADHLSAYGYERDTTPTLKRFAEEATFFSRAIAPSDMTLSSHASLFTGLYARRHGARLSDPLTHTDSPAGYPLSGKFHTLAEILSESGYRTMGVAANYVYLSHDFGLDRGFAYYSVVTGPPHWSRTPSFYLAAGVRQLVPALFAGAPPPESGNKAVNVNRQVFALLEQVKQERTPFFLFINYMDAHEPLLPPPPYDTLFPGKDSSIAPEVYYKISWHVNRLQENMPEAAKRHALSQYDGGIAYLDAHLGELFRKLKELSLYENALIIITSDHGEAFGDRGLAGHGLSVYQDLVHIPLLIRYPHGGRKVVVEEPVSLVDIMPTVLDVLGVRIPESFDGESLLKLHQSAPADRDQRKFSRKVPDGLAPPVPPRTEGSCSGLLEVHPVNRGPEGALRPVERSE